MNPTLDFTAEQMREMGYRVIDQVVQHLSTLSSQRVGAKAPVSVLAQTGPIPENGSDFPMLLRYLEQDVLQRTMHVNHPRFFAYVPGPSNFIGVMADVLAAGYNVFAGTWISGSGAAAIELEAGAWLRELCGFPPSSAGIFVSGGSAANWTGLAVARHHKLGDEIHDGVVYFSDQTHSSVEKDLRVLGFGRRQIRKLGCDERFQLSLAALEEAVRTDRAAGLHPFCVVANAGTTNTGAVDPLPQIAGFCEHENLWMHIDGAYGAAVMACDRGKALLSGLERADSLSLDPHKWLFQPFECGFVLVRNGRALRETFEIIPEYLKDTHLYSAEVNLSDHGLQLTRSFRALKLWLSLKVFGMASIRAAQERGFALAELVESELERMPDWEVVSSAQMAIICFRYRDGDDAFHVELVQRIVADGFALVTSTTLRGRVALRMCPINPRTTDDDIRNTLRRLDELARGAHARIA